MRPDLQAALKKEKRETARAAILTTLKKLGVDKLRQKLDSWFNEIPPQEAVEDAE